jgi:molecular chaperone DnaK (HSP70)
MSKILGIDLGTTSSRVAVMEGREPRMIRDPDDPLPTASVVTLREDDDHVAGREARRQVVHEPESTVHSFKRLLGRPWEDAADEARGLTCQVERAEDGGLCVPVGEKCYTPPEIAAVLLAHVARLADDFLGEPSEGAVLAVPGWFEEAQRSALRDAARIAGLEVRGLVEEQTAAALAFEFGTTFEHDEQIALVDLGGGGCDVSVGYLSFVLPNLLSAFLPSGCDPYALVEVWGRASDGSVGGDAIDRRIVDRLVEEFEGEHRMDLRTDTLARARLREAAESAKVELSTARETDVELPYLAFSPDGPQHLACRLTRSELEKLASDIVDRAVGACERAVAEAGLKPGDIDRLVLLGGQSRMPSIWSRVADFFGQIPINLAAEECEDELLLPLEELVARGAAILGGALAGHDDASHKVAINRSLNHYVKLAAELTGLKASSVLKLMDAGESSRVFRWLDEVEVPSEAGGSASRSLLDLYEAGGPKVTFDPTRQTILRDLSTYSMPMAYSLELPPAIGSAACLDELVEPMVVYEADGLTLGWVQMRRDHTPTRVLKATLHWGKAGLDELVHDPPAGHIVEEIVRRAGLETRTEGRLELSVHGRPKTLLIRRHEHHGGTGFEIRPSP